MQQIQYRMQVELLSEAIFSSGEKEANTVQSKALTDSNGFVYYHAKSLKGLLKKKAIWILKHYAKIDEQLSVQFLHSIIELFGMNNEELSLLYEDMYLLLKNDSLLLKELADKKDCFQQCNRKLPLMKIGHLELPENVRAYYKKIYEQQLSTSEEDKDYIIISRHDLIEAQTHVRVGIQLQDGVIQDRMFTSMHTVRKGLVFYAPIVLDGEVTDQVKDDFFRIIYALDRIGAGIHRGYGEIKTRLLIQSSENFQQKGERWHEVCISGY